MLGLHDEVDGPLGRLLQPRLPRHAERLAEGDRGDAVAVHHGLVGRPHRQVAVGLLVRDQPSQAAGDVVLVTAGERSVAVTEQRQERQARGPRVGGVAALARELLAAGPVGEGLQLPAAVLVLHDRQPMEAAANRLERLGPAAEGVDELLLRRLVHDPLAEHLLQADLILGVEHRGGHRPPSGK